MSCSCPRPTESSDSRKKAGFCNQCGLEFGDEVLTPENIVWFYDRLESCFPGKAPPAFTGYRREAESREEEGRDKFGLSYLWRQNLKEAAEEESDSSNYRLFEALKQRRAGREDDDILDLLLQGAYHAFLAYECDRKAEARLHGSP